MAVVAGRRSHGGTRTLGRRSSTTPSRLAAAIHRSQRVADRADLVRLVGKLASGCRSYLELFGLDHVFHGLDFERQKAVAAGGRTYYLDLLRLANG